MATVPRPNPSCLHVSPWYILKVRDVLCLYISVRDRVQYRCTGFLQSIFQNSFWEIGQHSGEIQWNIFKRSEDWRPKNSGFHRIHSHFVCLSNLRIWAPAGRDPTASPRSSRRRWGPCKSGRRGHGVGSGSPQLWLELETRGKKMCFNSNKLAKQI